MVVCNTRLVPMAPNDNCYPLNAPLQYPQTPTMCAPMPALLPSGHIITPVPYSPSIPPPQVPLSRPSSNDSLSPPDYSLPNVIACNIVNPNMVSPSVPMANGLPPLVNFALSFKPNTTSIVPCNGNYSSSPPPPFIVYTSHPITPSSKSLNGISPLIQYMPRMCPLQPPIGNIELCPLQMPLCTPLPTCSWKQSYGMEQVWQSEFYNLFNQYGPHLWKLLPTMEKPTGNWNTVVDSAKVRFCCEDCGHGWTSMKGRVAFWFVLSAGRGEGYVCLKLYGQQCDRCKTGKYEPAMWYPEEVVKVLMNIYNKVGQVYYGFVTAPYHKERRAGKPRTPHNGDLCQACKDGVCAERR